MFRRKRPADNGVNFSMDAPMRVQQLGPPPDARITAANLALAHAQYSAEFDMAKIMLNAETFLLFLTDDRIKMEDK